MVVKTGGMARRLKVIKFEKPVADEKKKKMGREMNSIIDVEKGVVFAWILDGPT